MPGSISPKVEQAAVEAYDLGVYFSADTMNCVDIEPNVIDELKRMMLTTRLKLNGVSGDLTKLPFKNQFFNIITINHPFDDLLYYLVKKDYPYLVVEYNLELSGKSVAKQAEVRNEMVQKIIHKKDMYFNTVKDMLLKEPQRILMNKGLLVIVNYFTNNWRRYDQYLNSSFSDKIFSLTHDLFEFVRSHATNLENVTESVPIREQALFSEKDKVEYVLLSKS